MSLEDYAITGYAAAEGVSIETAAAQVERMFQERDRSRGLGVPPAAMCRCCGETHWEPESVRARSQ